MQKIKMMMDFSLVAVPEDTENSIMMECLCHKANSL